MKKIFVVLLIVLTFAAAYGSDKWPEEPTGYRGIAWGTSMDETIATIKGWPNTEIVKIFPPAPSGASKCQFSTMVGDVKVIGIAQFNARREFTGAVFAFETLVYGTMEKTLVSKFGKAQKENFNPSGKALIDRMWVGETSLVQLLRNFEGLQQGLSAFQIVSLASLGEQEKKMLLAGDDL